MMNKDDKARSHCAVKTYLETLKLEVLPNLSYNPDIAPFDYYLCRSMQHGLADQHFSNYDELALHALPHPAHPASARETCIACGSSDLTLAHRYWSCSSIRPLIREAFNIIQQPPDLRGWLFGQGLDDDALTILASAKSSIHRFFLSLEMRGERLDGNSKRKRQTTDEDSGPGRHGCPTSRIGVRDPTDCNGVALETTTNYLSNSPTDETF
ncbi:hypothetical protein LAZ67_20001040 [Cordylochernes scorpioides]|uniref:Uncharacterized protein n=1 Tax=Cordylochernes scorpioides TaxID=51811 RepID=A0ABY6LJP4_9ARAC|nr:hypothetical protein LAZ67_20001040 [Cordylochernes scorpioides]